MQDNSANSDLKRAYAEMAAVYERQALTWDQQRSRSLVERVWLERFLAGLPPNGAVLDLGCGAGEPIAGYFIARGRAVVGIDLSTAMLELARQRFPEHLWLCEDMRALKFLGPVAGVISWDAFFHLSPQEQRHALPKIASLVQPGGSLLATVGWGEGEAVGHVGGEAVYHGSLNSAEYESLLLAAGFADVSYHEPMPGEIDRWVVFARGKRTLG